MKLVTSMLLNYNKESNTAQWYGVMGVFKVKRTFNLPLMLYTPRRLSQTSAHHTEVLSHLQVLPLHAPKLHAARCTQFRHSHLSSPSIAPARPENAAAPGPPPHGSSGSSVLSIPTPTHTGSGTAPSSCAPGSLTALPGQGSCKP